MCQSLTRSGHVMMSIRNISPVIIRTLLETGQSKKFEIRKMKKGGTNGGSEQSEPQEVGCNSAIVPQSSSVQR